MKPTRYDPAWSLSMSNLTLFGQFRRTRSRHPSASTRLGSGRLFPECCPDEKSERICAASSIVALLKNRPACRHFACRSCRLPAFMSLWLCLSPFGPASVILDESQRAEKVQGGVCLGLGPCPRSGLLPGEWHREEGGGNVYRWAEKGWWAGPWRRCCGISSSHQRGCTSR